MKEMSNVRPAFDECEGTAFNIDAAYQKVTCHMIFDVKMLDSDGIFRRKAWYVAGGHTKEKLQQPSLTHLSYHKIRYVLH